MKYRVQLVNNHGDIIDESADSISAADAIGLIRAWESIILTLRDIAAKGNKPNDEATWDSLGAGFIEVEPDYEE